MMIQPQIYKFKKLIRSIKFKCYQKLIVNSIKALELFELLSKAHDLFKSSELEEKRRIITIMFPNLLLDSENLVFTTRKPLDLFLNVMWCNWQKRLRILRTKKIEEIMNFGGFVREMRLLLNQN